MQKVNLLYVITKLELGGAQKQLLSLITYLDKDRYRISLITARDGLLINNALSISGLRLLRSGYLERAINPIKDFFALYEIYCFIKKNRIEIVHTHSLKAGLLGRWAAGLARLNFAFPALKRICNIKKGSVRFIVHTVHGWSFNECQNYLWRRIIIWLERLTALITNKLIVVSRWDLQKGLSYRVGSRDKYKLIRYGINYNEFIPLEKSTTGFNARNNGLRRQLGISASELTVGMVSCFKTQKSPQDFVRLAYLVNSYTRNADKSVNRAIGVGVKFILIGDGVLRKKIERLIYELNLGQKVILTGWRQDIARILSAIDIFVLTSLWEGLPISVLEAMASSLPVVVTNTGGIAEVLVEGKTGFLVSPRDIKRMAEKLNCLLRNENLRKQIGRDARSSLKTDFSVENMGMSTESLYRGIETQAGKYAH